MDKLQTRLHQNYEILLSKDMRLKKSNQKPEENILKYHT